MTDKPKMTVDLTTDEIFPIGWGLIYRVVCSPKDKTDEEISNYISAIDPPGTSANRWVVTPPDQVAAHAQWCEGYKTTENRAQCPDCADRVHVLMNC